MGARNATPAVAVLAAAAGLIGLAAPQAWDSGLDLPESLVTEAGAAAGLTTDLHLAALAIEHQGELHSNDADFSRSSGLRWTNPLR